MSYYYKEFMSHENQEALRDRLVKCMKKGALSAQLAGPKMKLCPATLRKFLRGVDLTFPSLCRVESWILSEENL